VILFFRAMFGAAKGIIHPFAMAFIVLLFDGKERDAMMGYRSALGNLCGIIFLQLGATLATINARYAFFGILLMVPFLILIIARIPSPDDEMQEKIKAAKALEEKEGKKKGNLTPKTWFMYIATMCWMFFCYVFFTDNAIVISAFELGSPMLSANVMTVFSITSMILGLVFGKIIRPVFKRFSVTLGMVSLSATMLVIGFNPTVLSLFIGGVFFGIGFSVFNVALYLDVAKTVHPNAGAQAMGWLMAFTAFGQFVSPMVTKFIAGLVGFDTPLYGFQVAGPVMLAASVICIIVKIVRKPGLEYADKINQELHGAA
jgi:MFS family permease